MTVTLLIAAALAGQAPVTIDGDRIGPDQVDVAYEELAKRQPNAAIERIRSNTDIGSNDPAALINLGSAYAMKGDRQKAAECYRAAIASADRYDLETADGSWVDSRRLARMALANLDKRERTALR